MPSSDPTQRFLDILQNIERIGRYTADVDVTVFVDGGQTRDAVERCLERICEAAKKLGPVAEALCPDNPWPQIRGLGNFLRHEYDRIEGERLWYLVERDLPPLRTAVIAALESLR